MAEAPLASAAPLTHWIHYEIVPPAQPSVVHTLRVGELAHAAAMARFGRLTGGATSSRLSGRDADGRPNRTHQHAHWFALDEDCDRRLDHLILWVPGGLGARETAACLLIDGLRESTAVAGRDALSLRLSVTDTDAGAGVRTLPAWLVGPGTHWRSVTPFVPPRHTKFAGSGPQRRIVEAPADQLLREVVLRHIPGNVVALGEIDPLALPAGRLWRPAVGVRAQERGRLPSVAVWWDLIFDRPVRGPLSFGHAAHYGMGLFVPLCFENSFIPIVGPPWNE